MGNLLSFFRFGFYPIPHTIHSNNTKHTHAHTLTHSHTHTTINKAMPTLAALPAASLLSLAKRTTTITSSVGGSGVGGSNNFAVVHKKNSFFAVSASQSQSPLPSPISPPFWVVFCICCILLLLILCTIYSTPCSAILHILLLMTFSPFCHNIKHRRQSPRKFFFLCSFSSLRRHSP